MNKRDFALADKTQSEARSVTRLVVAITGASGAVYGVRVLEALKAMPEIETHLVVSDAGELNLQHELGMTRGDLTGLVEVQHDVSDIGAQIASGSFGAAGMIVAPCSMKTLASVAHGFGR